MTTKQDRRNRRFAYEADAYMNGPETALRRRTYGTPEYWAAWDRWDEARRAEHDRAVERERNAKCLPEF